MRMILASVCALGAVETLAAQGAKKAAADELKELRALKQELTKLGKGVDKDNVEEAQKELDALAGRVDAVERSSRRGAASEVKELRRLAESRQAHLNKVRGGWPKPPEIAPFVGLWQSRGPKSIRNDMIREPVAIKPLAIDEFGFVSGWISLPAKNGSYIAVEIKPDKQGKRVDWFVVTAGTISFSGVDAAARRGRVDPQTKAFVGSGLTLRLADDGQSLQMEATLNGVRHENVLDRSAATLRNAAAKGAAAGS